MGRAVITGATKGIGRAIAFKLVEEGYDVALCARSKQDLEDTRQALRELRPGAEVLIRSVDMGISREVLDFGAMITEHWPHIDVLVNNAGIFIPGKVSEEPEGTLENMMAVNVYSAYHLTRSLLPALGRADSAHIFNMCSIASTTAYPNGGSYSISKFALLGFSKVLREELKPRNIKVTSLLPGATWSDSWRGVDLPEDRLMQAQDIAIAVWSALQMSPSAVVEEIILRPQLGDL
jgi:short-subunit dehydrogenase